jgi:hypothetical protein
VNRRQESRVLAAVSCRESEKLYFVMPVVDGESLRKRLTRECHILIEDALYIGREVAVGTRIRAGTASFTEQSWVQWVVEGKRHGSQTSPFPNSILRGRYPGQVPETDELHSAAS